MRLINIKCDNIDSFKYSILYLYYYNIKLNYNRPTEINKHRDSYMFIHFNDANNINQFEKDNRFIDILIVDINNNLLSLTHNNANIKVTIVKSNDYRHSLCKLTLECFNNNINGINSIYTTTHKIYKLTDRIKEDLRLNVILNIYVKNEIK